jgi:hypothetical protein
MATALLAVITTSAFAANTPPNNGPAPTGDPVTTRQGDIASPGEPFFPETSSGPKPGKSPMPVIECWMVMGEDGIVSIYFKNLSGKTLPPGPNFPTELGDGEHFTLKSWDEWEPGEVKLLTKSNYDGPLTCTTEVELPEDEDDVPH